MSIYLSIYLFICRPIHPSTYIFFWQGAQFLVLPREATSEPSTEVRTSCFLCIFTSKCASRHNGVHFFDIATSESGPNLYYFQHFDFEMCASRHNGVRFSTSTLPKVVRSWGVLNIHNGVLFFISHLASWLRTRRVNEATFRPSWDPNYWKILFFATFLSFRPSAFSFFFLLMLLFSLPLLCSAFHLSILSEIWRLNFLRPNRISEGISEKNIKQNRSRYVRLNTKIFNNIYTKKFII